MTFKRRLSIESPLYKHLSPLSLFNLHVGEDDLTCDKDWKHVFKRLRNLLLRDRGILIDDFRITPAVTKAHMGASGQSSVHINSVFNPNDLQDVRLAFQLLQDVWSLPPLSSSESTNPGTARGREALRVLGKLLHHLVYAYVCVDLTLAEQLEHLSAAAHLLFVLFKTAGKDFIPTLLYVDIILMIKNVFFCIAKAKVETPDACFFIILLGTDRLEIQFGILRTVIGNDANLDVLQISERASGLIDIADILALRPDWDKGPRRLEMPTLSRLGSDGSMPASSDHLSPKNLKGRDYYVKNVTLLTCWRRGRAMAESEYAPAAEILQQAEQDGTIDMLSPKGALLVDAPLEDEIDESSEALLLSTRTSSQTNSASAGGSEVAVDVEDELQELNIGPGGQGSSGGPQFERTIVMNGKTMPKAKALAMVCRYRKSTSSTDRLKRVQEIERYHASQTEQTNGYDNDSRLLLIHDPIATLVHTQDHLWLVLGEVNGIRYDGRLIDRVGHGLLAEPSVKISFQVTGLRPTASDDGQGELFDWRTFITPGRTFEVPGKLIEALDPELSKGSMKPFYLFKSGFLVATAALLAQRLAPPDLKQLPKMSATTDFPYRERGGKNSNDS
jgi:hypothetical protein